jgi:hypothetical protein
MLQCGNLVFVRLLIYNQLMLCCPLPSALGIVSKKIHKMTLVIDVLNLFFRCLWHNVNLFQWQILLVLTKYCISELHCEAKPASKNVILI